MLMRCCGLSTMRSGYRPSSPTLIHSREHCGMASSPSLEDRVVAALDAIGEPYAVMECDPAFADTAAFCEKYGVAPEDSANTIVVASKKEPRRYVACVVLATT